LFLGKKHSGKYAVGWRWGAAFAIFLASSLEASPISFPQVWQQVGNGGILLTKVCLDRDSGQTCASTKIPQFGKCFSEIGARESGALPFIPPSGKEMSEARPGGKKQSAFADFYKKWKPAIYLLWFIAGCSAGYYRQRHRRSSHDAQDRTGGQ
jgi:hypothetical protein